METYTRVVPRDLFNEANLLKCFGRLAILTDRHRGIEVTEPDAGCRFEVEQNEDGGLVLANVRLLIWGRECDVDRPLNSRRAWPLYLRACGGEELDEAIEIFDNDGNLTNEIKGLIRRLEEPRCLED